MADFWKPNSWIRAELVTITSSVPALQLADAAVLRSQRAGRLVPGRLIGLGALHPGKAAPGHQLREDIGDSFGTRHGGGKGLGIRGWGLGI